MLSSYDGKWTSEENLSQERYSNQELKPLRDENLVHHQVSHWEELVKGEGKEMRCSETLRGGGRFYPAPHWFDPLRLTVSASLDALTSSLCFLQLGH